ncbi:MAG TPA: SDR family NAD(P)-dependent oxidoreductase [Candidatus Acidoferrales bacterium]|jgi:NAD(P)-dependent dehydrogenase (short-subunit alcohol dehydrogenase family)|nr:SDR family NAD(P)-dependent oxidoreductase [Candidatus Acidoferrales bacterium]
MTTPENRQTGRLADKHAVVTGGTRGIGEAVARMLLAHGARVTITGRNPAGPEAFAEMKQTGEIAYVQADVTDASAVKRAFEQAIARSGPISVLVNNAGQAASAPFLKTDAELWRRLMAVNLDGTFHCAQAALPGMLAAGWGRIVNIASVAGLKGYGYVTAYCASKHAVVGLTRALAMEFVCKGITVNAVCPGYTETDMVKNAISNITSKTGRSAEEAVAELTSHNPQKRLIQPAEVANAVAWLCLPGSEAITGQAIAVAGGEVM